MRKAHGPCAALALSLWLAAVVWGTAAGGAAAQEPGGTEAVADSRTFQESFDPNAAVSASSLVGLSIGRGGAGLRPDAVTLVALPRDAAGAERPSRICVRSTTRDGRFTASNPYLVGAGGGPVRIRPLTVLYGDVLASYAQADFALRAYLAEGGDCSPRGKLNLPEMRAGGTLEAPLVAVVNGQSRRVTASLLDADGRTLAEAPCERPAGVTLVAFDLVCELGRAAAAPEGGRAVLRLVFDDGFATETSDFAVLLPPAR